MLYARTPYARGMQDPIEQPLQFDHRHHTRDEGIDCRYCHNTVDKSPSAGIPPTQLCLNCHSQVWNKSPLLEPVRQSFIQNKPLEWRRVYKVPEFVYFNHAIHVNKGVGCVSCHGRVDKMAAVEKDTTLTMGFCLDCHRHPDAEPPAAFRGRQHGVEARGRSGRVRQAAGGAERRPHANELHHVSPMRPTQ